MATEISKLLNDISAFMKFVSSIKATVENIMQNLEKSVSFVCDQLEVYSISRNATVPRNILQHFPDVKQRLLSDLNSLIDEEITEIRRCVNRISEFTVELKKLYEKIEKHMMKIEWREHVQFVNAFTLILEWAGKCWKYFHYIYMSIQSGLLSVMKDSEHASDHLKFTDTIDDVDRKYIFNNPIIDMFHLLEMDISSRGKITVR